MIRESFILLDSIRQKREQMIWQQDIKDWNQFLDKEKIKGISPLRKSFYNRQLELSRKALLNENASFFSKKLPHQEYWRLYNEFKEDAVFLDIETTSSYGGITIIGLYDGEDTKTFIRGRNLDKKILQKVISNYKLILTFNDSSFDIPIINKYFANVIPKEIPHIDLRHVCSKIHLTGGLKSIEKQIGIKRPSDVELVNGEEAVRLWDLYWATGDDYYLNLLVKYNEEDIINLKPVADFAIKQLWLKTRNLCSKPPILGKNL